MNSTFKTVVLWAVVLAVGIGIWKVMQGGAGAAKDSEISYTDFMAQVAQNNVDDVTIDNGNNLAHGKYRNDKSKTFHVFVPANNPEMLKALQTKDATGYSPKLTFKDSKGSDWPMMLLQLSPILLIGVLWFVMIRQMQSGGNKALSFGKSRARLLSMQQKKVTFKDVAGVDEAKEELREIIEFLREAQKFQKLGGRIPKGVLLVGHPGTGKTLLARAVAGEANVPFFSISGSDFVEMFVGVGASRVRDLFEQGKKNAPCIIFIDEIDAVGRHRGAGLGGGHDEREQTLNQLLVEMDGFESNEGVILIAATNRPDVLDPALLRPGRFDRRVVVPLPDVRGREEILRVHTRKIPLADDVDLSILARGSPGFSGAEISNMVNEAALNAARNNRKSVLMYDFELAKDKVLMGAERKSLLLTDEEKKVTAYHEAGHALVAALMPHSDPLHKVTIIPRGMALGVTMQLPETDKHNYTLNYLETPATEMARKMVCEWGMSSLGPLTFGKKEEQIFLGRELAQHRDFSEETAKEIDSEIRRLVNTGYENAKKIISGNKETLVRIALALLEREVLDAADMKLILEGKQLPARVLPPKKGDEGVQQVLRPEPGRTPGIAPGKPSPA